MCVPARVHGHAEAGQENRPCPHIVLVSRCLYGNVCTPKYQVSGPSLMFVNRNVNSSDVILPPPPVLLLVTRCCVTLSQVVSQRLT